MKLTAKQLSSHVNSPLKPIYWVSGEEDLLVQEAGMVIRQAARAAGFNERIVLHHDTGFDAEQFSNATRTLSLFHEKTLVELYLPEKKLTEKAIQPLKNYAENPAPDKILLIISDKVTAPVLKSPWAQAVDQNGVIIQIQSIKNYELQGWIKERLQKLEFQIDAEGLRLMCLYGEGNLLALAQAIEKLKLLYAKGPLNHEKIKNVIIDSARYDIFALGDGVLEGDKTRVIKILNRLKQEGFESILVLWALVRELRVLIKLAELVNRGKTVDQAMSVSGIWEKKKPMVKRALSRYSNTQWTNLLEKAKQIDGTIKGAERGNVWEELSQLALAIAGVNLF